MAGQGDFPLKSAWLRGGVARTRGQTGRFSLLYKDNTGDEDSLWSAWFFGSAGPQTLVATEFSNANTFFAATLTQDAPAHSLSPSLLTNTQSFYAPEVALVGGATQNLTATRLVNTQTFFAPIVGRGSATLTPTLFSDADQVFTAALTSVRSLTPALFSNADQFFSPAATTSRTLTAARLDNTQTFFASTLTQTAPAQALSAARFDNQNTFFSAATSAVTRLLPSLVAGEGQFFAPSVLPGGVGLSPSFFDGGTGFFGPGIRAANQLGPPGVSAPDQFFSPGVEQFAILRPALWSMGNVFPLARLRRGVAPPNWAPISQPESDEYTPLVSVSAPTFVAAGALPPSSGYAPAPAPPIPTYEPV